MRWRAKVRESMSRPSSARWQVRQPDKVAEEGGRPRLASTLRACVSRRMLVVGERRQPPLLTEPNLETLYELIRRGVIDARAASPARAHDEELEAFAWAGYDAVVRGADDTALSSRWIDQRVTPGFSPRGLTGDRFVRIPPQSFRARGHPRCTCRLGLSSMLGHGVRVMETETVDSSRRWSSVTLEWARQAQNVNAIEGERARAIPGDSSEISLGRAVPSAKSLQSRSKTRRLRVSSGNRSRWSPANRARSSAVVEGRRGGRGGHERDAECSTSDVVRDAVDQGRSCCEQAIETVSEGSTAASS